MPVSNNSYQSACQMVARLGGEQLMKHRDNFRTREKAPADLVTDADLASQTAIHDALHSLFPNHQFLGEEKLDLPMMANTDSPWRWIVDPLDGTLNYVHQLQSYSVSVALEYAGRVIAGAVYDPWLEEMYSADVDGPALLNGAAIQVSGCHSLDRALAVISLPTRIERASPVMEEFLEILMAARSVRRLGSAALNLCYLAAGRVDLYWATTLKCWDIAAGSLILERAGGCITNPSGKPLDLMQPQMIAASTPQLNQATRELLQSR